MFTPIQAGLFGVISINRKLRELWTAVMENRAALNELREAAGLEPVGAKVAEAPVEVQPEPAPETEQDGPEPKTDAESDEATSFDWQTSDDVEAIRAWALETHNLKIGSNIKKADTARGQIEAFLTQE